MKKNAICFHGISSGSTDKSPNLQVDIAKVFKNIDSNLISLNDCDVYFHTWGHENISQILSIFEPLDYLVEDQIIFHKNNLLDKLKHIRRKLLFAHDHPNRKNALKSRWYSFKQSVDLATNHAKKNNFTYNNVFVTRFDLALNKMVNFNILENQKFYVGNWPRWFDDYGNEINEIDISKGAPFKSTGKKGWPHDNEGLHDFWFLSNLDIMNEFSKCYEDIDALIDKCGLSSHKIALQKLKDMKEIDNLEFHLDFVSDYTLARWRQ